MKLPVCVLLVLALAAGPGPARADAQDLGVVDCAGVLAGERTRGPVLAELWRGADGTGRLGRGQRERVLSALLAGDVRSAPGIVRLFGRFERRGPELQFEVYLREDGNGVGSAWYQGRRAEEQIVHVALTAGGLRIDRSGEVLGSFACSG